MKLDDWEKPIHCSTIKHRLTGIEFYLDYDPGTGESVTRVLGPNARNLSGEKIERLKIEAEEAYNAYEEADHAG